MFSIGIEDSALVISIFFIKFKIKLYKILRVISFLDLIIPKKKDRICFCVIHEHISVCSEYYNYLKKNCKDKYDIVELVTNIDDCKKFDNAYYYRQFNLIGLYKVFSSKIVIAGNTQILTDIFSSKKRTYLYFNHGMPIKTLGFSAKVEPYVLRRYRFFGENAKFFVTSDIFKNFTTSCFKANFKDIYITGTPRNDLIGSTKNDDKLKEMFNFEKYNKVVLYMPTYLKKKNWIKTEIGKNFENIFRLDDYNECNFIETIEKNNILFIMKPHPWEEFFYQENPEFLPKSNNFKIVYKEDFYSKDIEHYELFKFIDCMVSDFSSAPIDYLILNRPVVYLNSLAEDYGATRGMILEDNYEILMPGLKVKTYAEFEKALLDALTVDSFKQKREELLPLIHKYRDFNSCERIYNIMKELKL